MRKSSSRYLEVLPLFSKFISHSKSGKRLQPNGKKISAGTLQNYHHTFLTLEKFSRECSFELRVLTLSKFNKTQVAAERKYWKNFYRRFTGYLYESLGCYDNYVGGTIKNVRTFFNYLNKELGLGVGEFHKSFYVRKEEISIFPLLPDELKFIISDKGFAERLKPRMLEVKDFFVFGCTVGLRFSDLIRLKKSNVRKVRDQYFLGIISRKTNVESLIKLPDYAVEIIKRYEKLKTRLLPKFNIVNLNKFIKKLLEQAGLVHPVQTSRQRRGVAVTQQKADGTVRFCDVATTHTMRRTAITTMLGLGMKEQLVRKISGHSPSSKDFYRYVLWAQAYQDTETQRVFEKLNIV